MGLSLIDHSREDRGWAMKICIVIFTALVGISFVALPASTGALAQAGRTSNDRAGTANNGDQKAATALPKTNRQKTGGAASQSAISDRWGNMRSPK